ncbi:hypothetical protein A3Q56_07950, partial [Intoshia linei]
MYFKEFLRVNHLLLISNLRISNNFMNNLSNERIINRIMIESIENQKNNNLKINYLLKVVAYRDKNLIPFLKILQKFGEINILSKLNTSNLPVNVKDSVSVLLKNVTDQENYCLKNTNHSVYRMKSVPRGNAIIINNIDFSKSYNNLSNRDGSLKDVDDLVDIFTKLLFIAKVYTNLNVKEMLDTFNSEAKKLEHKNRDCFVLIILSHGFKNHVFGVLGQSLLISKITNIFNGLNCPYLIGKPKIFIIQACQGECPLFLLEKPILHVDAFVDFKHLSKKMKSTPEYLDLSMLLSLRILQLVFYIINLYEYSDRSNLDL